MLEQPRIYNPAAGAVPSPGGGCRFRAILQVSGASSGNLKLVETNTFKDLPHLTLQLRAGTDASIKQARFSSHFVSNFDISSIFKLN